MCISLLFFLLDQIKSYLLLCVIRGKTRWVNEKSMFTSVQNAKKTTKRLVASRKGKNTESEDTSNIYWREEDEREKISYAVTDCMASKEDRHSAVSLPYELFSFFSFSLPFDYVTSQVGESILFSFFCFTYELKRTLSQNMSFEKSSFFSLSFQIVCSVYQWKKILIFQIY